MTETADKTVAAKAATYVDASGDYGRVSVPIENRKSLFSISMVTIGYTVCMSGLFTGAALAAGMTLENAIIATLIGNLIVSLYSGLCASIGTRYGVSATMLTRQAFGRSGAKLIGVIIAISLTGWYSYQCGFFGETIAALIPNGGFLVQPQIAAFWGGLLMMVTAILGFKGLQTLSNIGVPSLIAICILGIIKGTILIAGGSGVTEIAAGSEVSIMSGVTMAVGAVAVAGVVQSDISRYAKNIKHCWISTFIGFICGNSFVIITGVIFIKATGATVIPSAMVSLGLGVLGLFILIISQWTTNDNNLYSSSLGLLQIIPHVKKAYITAALGIAGTIAGTFGIYNFYVPFLNFLGSVIPPVSGIIIADFYLVKKSYSFGEGTEYCLWNLSSLIALVVGCLVGLYVNIGISSINGLVSGFLVHLIMSKIMKQKAGYGKCFEDATGF